MTNSAETNADDEAPQTQDRAVKEFVKRERERLADEEPLEEGAPEDVGDWPKAKV
jgi:hypothetical protein